eukprot:UN08689
MQTCSWLRKILNELDLLEKVGRTYKLKSDKVDFRLDDAVEKRTGIKIEIQKKWDKPDLSEFKKLSKMEKIF